MRGVAQQPQPLLAEPLEAVGRAARLERAAAEDLRAGPPHRRRCGAHLLLVFRRARTGHHDDLVAADADVADRDDRSLGLEGPARELVRRRDPQHLVDAVEHLDQAGVGMPLADGAEHGPLDTGRSVDVHAHLDQPRDDLLDLVLGGPFLHHYDHGFCRLQPATNLTSADRPDRGVLAVDHPPFEPPRLVDDAFEQPRDGVGAQRPFRRDAPHVREHLLLALGLIELDALFLLQPPDLARHARALVQQPDQHLVHPIDVVAQIVKRAHARLSATARSSSTRLMSVGEPLASAIIDTSALPTTAASA